jgi:hypothetical protein
MHRFADAHDLLMQRATLTPVLSLDGGGGCSKGAHPVSSADRGLAAPCWDAEGGATLAFVSERRIRITAGAVSAEAVLNGSAVATVVWDALPLAAPGQTWGDEIYFAVPVRAKLEAPREVVALGDLGYWPPGSAFCIFFGPTPMSRGDEIRPASAVEVFGSVVGDATVFKKVRSGISVRVERAAP